MANLGLKKFIKSPWLWSVLSLVFLRVILLVLALNNAPHLDVIKEDWLFNAGSDARSYFRTAKSFFEGPFSLNPLGWPLVFSLLVGITSAETLNNVASSAVVLNSVVFYTLATILVYLIAKKFLGKKYKALIIAGFFNIYPYLFFYFIDFFGKGSQLLARSNEVMFMWFSFLGILSEPLSCLLMLLALYLILKITESKKQDFKIALATGAVCGWAVITRFQNAVIVPLYGVILLVLKKFKTLGFVILGGLPFVLLQGLADYLYGSSALNVDYRFSTGTNPDEGMLLGVKYMFRIIRYPLENCPLFFIPMGLMFLLLGFGIYRLIKQQRKLGIVLTSYLAFNIIPFLFFESAIRNPRYFLPVLPISFIYMYAGGEQIFSLLRKMFRGRGSKH